MVIPWVGFPLADLIKKCEPTSKAKYVEFTTLFDPKQMPGLRTSVLRWPYVEGLRLDEAMHPLTILAVGLYGEVIPEPERRAAAPRRAVEVRLQAHQVDRRRSSSSRSSRSTPGRNQAPQRVRVLREREPAVDHPRWSQATERRIGEFLRRKTLMFNGYGDQVASLYTRHGSEEELLGIWGLGLGLRSSLVKLSDRAVRFGLKPVVFLASLGPFVYLVWAALTGISAPTRSAISPTKPASGRSGSSASRSRSRRCAS